MTTDFKYKTWTNNTYPTGPTSATIYFHGVFGLCFDDKRCEAGVNSKALSHELNIQVRKRGTPPCAAISLPLPSDFSSAAKNNKLHIRVNNPVQSGVFVFDPDPPGPPVGGRYSYLHYGFDIEGPRMHNRPVKKISSALWPRFSIDNGLFYTQQVSKSRFALKRGGTTGQERIIGLVQAADIYLNSGGSIKFYLNDETSPRLTLPESAWDKYEIAITNSCRSTPVPTARTDFYMHYDVVDSTDVPPADRFDLYITHDGMDRNPVKLGPCQMGDFEFSDPAPCLPVTFGKSSNLD